MNKHAIYHVSHSNYCYPVAPDTLRIRLRTARGEVQSVRLYYQALYEHVEPFIEREMTRLFSDSLFDYYETDAVLEGKRFKYFFEIISQDESLFYSSDGLIHSVTEAECFFFPYINDSDIIALPEWARGGIIYQIWVDRFFNGDHSNDPADVCSIDKLPDRNTCYGGDFEGVIQKLPYIKELGATIIYLNPVFKSSSYHKYDVSDYYEVDSAYGGAEKLRELVQRAHEQGLRVVLDCVFNHCSSENPLFIDVVEKGKHSRYRDWFCIKSFPVDTENGNYDSFGGLVPEMPRLNTDNDEVIDYLIGFAEHWTQHLGIDGWRLDVADEVSHKLWREFRKRLCAKNPDLLIIGEVWNHAAQWLDGYEAHTATNYRFRKHALAFCSGLLNAQGFWNAFFSDRSLYKTPVNDYRINLMGSHDTARLLTLVEDERKALLLQLLTLTLEGIPLIYYGDELPMEGGDDPDNRRAMRWDLTSSDFRREIAQVCALHRESRALREGRTEPVDVGERTLAFTRSCSGERAAVAFNFADKPISFALCGREITLPPLGHYIHTY